jgi:hypothetical protein
MKKSALLAFIFLIFAFACKAQQVKRFNPDTIRTIVIDSAVNIHSHKLNVQDFIDAVLNDTSFYQAFRNMKHTSFTAENYIYTYDKNNKIDGKIYRKLKRTNKGGIHMVEYLAKRDSGNVYKKDGKYQLYTVNMFDYIFANAYTARGSGIGSSTSVTSGGKDQSYKDKLKVLIFAPGHRVDGIPFISNKTEIFSPDMRQFYDYQFARGKYLDSIPVYRFKVIQKSSTQDNDVVIKELTTIFDTRTFQVLGRYVNLKFHNMFIDFDVQMNMELNRFNGELLPTKITYQGNWDIPFHKTERASFLIVQKGFAP